MYGYPPESTMRVRFTGPEPERKLPTIGLRIERGRTVTVPERIGRQLIQREGFEAVAKA